MTLIRNNPDIDYDVLEAEIQRNLERLRTGDDTVEAGETESGEADGASSGIDSLRDLYTLNDREFIRAAYREFLGRDPDPEGEARYLEKLRQGSPKNRIAAALRYSPESRGHPQRFHLKKDRLLHFLARVPVVGRVSETLIAIAGSATLKKSVISLQRQADEARASLDDLNGRISRFNDDLNDMEYELNKHRLDSVATLQQQLAEMEFRLEQDIRALRLTPGSGARGESTAGPGKQAGEPIHEPGFYHRFEEHFRGPRALVSERMGYYLPLLEERLDPVLKTYPCVDIGCGRGEWLTLLKQQGYRVKGIDRDDTNTGLCRDQGLDVETGDGIDWLFSMASNSLALVTAFHVIEHLEFGQLNRLLAESLRTLAPGGFILFETPNPENLSTAANQFYIDPTHNRPLPPVLMEFLAGYRGFSDIEIHRLHPVEDFGDPIDDERTRAVDRLLFGPQDYAILARKGP